jgi:hypothetical protein
MDKQTLIDKLRAFAAQRPGMEPENYGDYSSYRSEARSITKDLNEARQLLRAVELRDSITVDDIKEALRRSYSGRLSLNEKGELDYCTGQYFPTEFRRAVCAVAASCLWDYTRRNNTKLDGDGLRKRLRTEFGAAIQRRWFN